jgi:hypothetical protein
MVGILLAERDRGTAVVGRVALVVGGEVTVEMSRGSFTALEIADSEGSDIAKSFRMVPVGGSPAVSEDVGGDEATAVNDEAVGSDNDPGAVPWLLGAEGEGCRT